MPDEVKPEHFAEEWLDLGHGVQIQRRFLPGSDEPAGIEWRHPRPDSGLTCAAGGWIPLGHDHGWTLESNNPLTITPSLLCRVCHSHGFITNGVWVPS